MTTLRLSGMDELLGAIDRGRTITLSSYVLHRGRLVDALEAAGDRGAAVRVRLESSPMDDARGDVRKVDDALSAELRSHGVAVELTAPGARSHLKAAIVDGRAFLDDRNWPDHGPDTILVDADPDDVMVVRRGIDGAAAGDAHLWTRKGSALQAEAALVRLADGPIAVESESFGSGAVARELETKARAGAAVRLLVNDREAGNPREASELRRLAAAGVAVRVAPFDEKLAVAGDAAWLGSANATAYPADQVDWGMRTGVGAVVGALRARFERNWGAAAPLP